MSILLDPNWVMASTRRHYLLLSTNLCGLLLLRLHRGLSTTPLLSQVVRTILDETDTPQGTKSLPYHTQQRRGVPPFLVLHANSCPRLCRLHRAATRHGTLVHTLYTSLQIYTVWRHPQFPRKNLECLDLDRSGQVAPLAVSCEMRTSLLRSKNKSTWRRLVVGCQSHSISVTTPLPFQFSFGKMSSHTPCTRHTHVPRLGEGSCSRRPNNGWEEQAL